MYLACVLCSTQETWLSSALAFVWLINTRLKAWKKRWLWPRTLIWPKDKLQSGWGMTSHWVVEALGQSQGNSQPSMNWVRSWSRRALGKGHWEGLWEPLGFHTPKYLLCKHQIYLKIQRPSRCFVDPRRNRLWKQESHDHHQQLTVSYTSQGTESQCKSWQASWRGWLCRMYGVDWEGEGLSLGEREREGSTKAGPQKLL